MNIVSVGVFRRQGHRFVQPVMADYVKRKIVEKLARFTKHLKPGDISLSFLTGKGELTNLELDSRFITEVLQLPPWIRISRVVCNKIKARVPFTSLQKEPVHFSVDRVEIEVATCVDEGPRQKHDDLLDKLGNPSKYGFTEKVIDGMKVEIHSIVVRFQDPTFHASLEMTDIVIQSTTHNWKPDVLTHTRHKIADEDSVIIYKMCTWTSLKLEGWSTGQGVVQEGVSLPTQLRLISGESSVRIALKRLMSNCSIVNTRVSVHLGSVIWILTQTQLRAVSRLVQSLMEAAVKTAQTNRQKVMDDSRSTDSSEADLQENAKASGKGQSSGVKGQSAGSTKKRGGGKPPTAKELAIKQRTADYRDGKLNLPSYEVIQDSFHFRTSKIDLQLCDDTVDSDSVQGSMLVQLCEVNVDVYLNQLAGSGRCHWNKANDLVLKNQKWSKKKIEKASKTQYMNLPSISLSDLREMGVVVRCGHFSIQALQSENFQHAGKKGVPTLPVITSDKKTFNIPDDFHNPAFQVGVSTYYYPDACGNKFLVPRSNTFAYFCPIHVNLHQQSCLWLVEFIHGVVQTVNVDLALSVHDEGKTFLESKQSDIQQLPGFDAKFKILFTKVTIPLPDDFSDGRPKALQIETAAIKAKNRTLDALFSMEHFCSALESVKTSWLFSTHHSSGAPQFPHLASDLPCFPSKLHEMLHHQKRVGRRRGSVGTCPRDTQTMPITPEGFEVVSTEGWMLETNCVHVAFADSYTHEATLYTKSFVDDFPLHVWLFLPQEAKHNETMASSPSPPQGDKNEPTISFVAHSPGVIRVELERLQLLFLMRLKDSFTAFKSTLMKFLKLPSPPTQQDRKSHDPSNRSHDPSASSHEQPEKVENATSDSQNDDKRTESPQQSSSKPPEILASIAGYIMVDTLQANIMLPTLYSDRPTKGTSTDDDPTTPGVIIDQGLHSLSANRSCTLDEVISSSSDVPGSSRASLTGNTGFNTPPPLDKVISSSTGDVPGSSQASSTGSTGLNTLPPLNPTSRSASQTSLASSQASQTSFQLSLASSDNKAPSPISSNSSREIGTRPSHYASTGLLYCQTQHTPPLRSVSATNISETLVEAATQQMVDTSQDEEDVDEHKPSSTSSLIEDFVMVDKLVTSSPSTQLDSQEASDGINIAIDVTIPSIQEVTDDDDVDATPKASTEQLLFSPKHSAQSSPSPRNSITSPASPKRMKSPPPPLREIPQYVLQVEVDNINVLTAIETSDITVKATAGAIRLKEIESAAYEREKNESQFIRRAKSTREEKVRDEPLVKARVEVGDQVTRYYPNAVDIDNIVIVTARDIELVLQIPNMVIMKDFFDDECETETPVPVHVRISSTKLVLLEHPEHGPDDWRSMAVKVHQADVHRGRELLSGIDVFTSGVPLVDQVEGVVCEGGEGVSGDSVRVDNRYGKLLESFKTFMDAIDSHMHQHSQLSVPHSHHVAGLLKELQSSLSSTHQGSFREATTLRLGPTSLPQAIGNPAAPPSYSEAVYTSGVSHHGSEVHKLHELQNERDRLESELIVTKTELIEHKEDFFMVTEECKKTKEELVTYKQVMEKLQGQIEELLSVNYDLKRQLSSPTS